MEIVVLYIVVSYIYGLGYFTAGIVYDSEDKWLYRLSFVLSPLFVPFTIGLRNGRIEAQYYNR